jgi:esterase/lipase superfamily enzyme
MLATLAAVYIVGCASETYQLMPTPVLYQEPSTLAVISQPKESRGISTDLDLLYITDRGPETDAESDLPYGQTRAKSIAFGSARVEIGSGVSWETLGRESRLAERTRDLDLSLGRVEEYGRFPDEPYDVELRADGALYRDRADMEQHERASRLLREELRRRLARSANKEVTLYVHGFNETFATAGFTAAELCHFLGREPVCAFFTWPASRTGNFLTSYSSTTESAQYAEDHLKQVVRMLATTPGVERLQLLAHSRGAGLLLKTVRDLFIGSLAMTPAVAGDTSGKTALGSALGGGAGAAIGKQIGGNTGAVIGGGAGAAVTTKGKGKTGAVIGGAAGGATGAAAGKAMGGGTAGQAAGAALGAGAGGTVGRSLTK